MTRVLPPVAAAILLVLATLLGPVGGSAQGAEGQVVDLRVPRTLLRTDPTGAGLAARVTLAEPAHVRLRITDFDGRTVRVLFEGDRRPGALERRWKGQDRAGRRVAPGPYRVEATVSPLDPGIDSGEARAEQWLTVAAGPIARRPGSVTVVVDPGHGGMFDGAVAPDGTREADLNLDIASRLARMLEGAGVHVILTRDTDREVNTPPIDRTFDGVIDVTDDLAARADIANAARADLFLAVHNNLAVNRSTGGPSTYFSDERTFRARSERLARIIQARMVSALTSVGSEGWRPHDHGVLTYPYYVLRGVDPPRLLRPTRMPGVLSEGLFLSNPRELRMLKRARVRQAMANGYYEAIADYLAQRGRHVGYALDSAPTEVVAGAPVELALEVLDRSGLPMRGWHLDVRATPAAALALGQTGPRRVIAERRIPGLGPESRRILRLTVNAPVEPGDWVLLVDALDVSGTRASSMGSPVLEIPLVVLPPAPASPGPPAAQSPLPAASRSP